MMLKVILRYSFLAIVLISCNKITHKVKYEGTVYTKYGFKVPNRQVYIFQAVDEYSTTKVGSGITDGNGHFEFFAKANKKNTCYFNVAPGDSGFIDHVKVNNKGQTGLNIYCTLK